MVRLLQRAVPADRLVRGAGFVVAIVVIVYGSAAAQEFDLRGADFRVVGDAHWTGGAWGGYHPIRLEITNFGPGRDLELRFAPHDRGEGVPTVRRRLRVEQNATARVTLSIPLVSEGNSGRFDLLLDGMPVESLRRDLTLMAAGSDDVPHPSLLIVSADPVDPTGFQAAAVAGPEWLNRSYPSGHFMAAGSGAVGDVRHAVVDPSQLPASWIDYSAVDLVAIRLNTLNELRPEERTALFDWVATGGRLIVYGVDASSNGLENLLRLFRPSAGDPGWTSADVRHRESLTEFLPLPEPTGFRIPTEGDPFPDLPGALTQLGGLLAGPPGARPLSVLDPSWPRQPEAFSVRRLSFGHVAAVPGDLLTATGADWLWLLRDLGGPAATWPVRNGLSSGSGDVEFINLPIPGVQGVPALAFLTLITLFAIAIGPANYFLLWRRRQLSRLVVTVPALAAATSVALFGYATFAHGFGSKGRVRSITLIDPATATATSVGRLALFSGSTPSGGLRFSKTTAVFPLYPPDEEFADGEVDWTETQALTAGWMRSSTRTQFVTVARRDERGRLAVAPHKGGLRVVNGFDVPFEQIVVTGEDGRAYFGNDLSAGGEAILRPLTDEGWTAVRTLALDRLPEPPDGVDPQEIAAGFGGPSWMWRRRGWQPQFRTGLLERHLARLVGVAPGQVAPPGDGAHEEVSSDDRESDEVRIDPAVRADTVDPLARPRGFLAIAAANPGIDVGGLNVDEAGSLHVLMGTW